MFAKKTKVPAEKSAGEIRKALTDFGAKKFSLGTGKNTSFIGFVFKNIPVKIEFETPEQPGGDATIAQKKKHIQATNTKWRQVHLCVKAKLESVVVGIETFEEGFMAHIETPNLGLNAKKHSKLGKKASSKKAA